MKLQIGDRKIDFTDIDDCCAVNTNEYHIEDMKPFLFIKLKTGEVLFAEDHVKIIDS